MRADLDITHGLIMAEAVTLALAEFIGKAEAHHHIEALCRRRWTVTARWSICSRLTHRSVSLVNANHAAGPGNGDRQRRTRAPCWRVIRSNVMNLDYQLDGPDGAPVIVLSNSLGTTGRCGSRRSRR